MNEKNKIFFIKGGISVVLYFLLLCSANASPQNQTATNSEKLKTPPNVISEFMDEKENKSTLYSDEIYEVYATEKAISNQDQTSSNTNNQITNNTWTFDVEARKSPVLEEHGNVERNESLGGIIKGTLHF